MKKLTLFSIFLAAVVIILGAYTRLTDAGLGCPDWPGCYGNLTVPLSEEKVAQANAAFPERPVEAFKAWNEMIHRYFAGTLWLCVLAIAIIAIRQRDKGTPVKLPLLLLGLIIFQAALGMWTDAQSPSRCSYGAFAGRLLCTLLPVYSLPPLAQHRRRCIEN